MPFDSYIEGMVFRDGMGCNARAVIRPRRWNGSICRATVFRLDGGEFVLADVLAPKAYALRLSDRAYHAQSATILSKIVTQKQPVLSDVAAAKTRWGAQGRFRSPFQYAQQTIEELLVSRGAVRVAPQSDGRDQIEKLLKVESIARENQRGLWGLSAYQVFDAKNAQDAIGGYSLIEGAPVEVSRHGGRVYINFGKDYDTDFTAVITSRAYDRWVREGYPLDKLAGRALRLRGYVRDFRGASLDVTHPQQIEII